MSPHGCTAIHLARALTCGRNAHLKYHSCITLAEQGVSFLYIRGTETCVVLSIQTAGSTGVLSIQPSAVALLLHDRRVLHAATQRRNSVRPDIL